MVTKRERSKPRVKEIQDAIRENAGMQVRQLPTDITGKKTTMMKMIEAIHQKDIRDLISKGSINKVGVQLGVNPATIYRWRLKFKD